MWGSLESCAALLTPLPGGQLPHRPINNRPQVYNLPHESLKMVKHQAVGTPWIDSCVPYDNESIPPNDPMSTTTLPALPLVVALSLASLAQADSDPAPPVAKRVEHRQDRHGATVIDNYYWLREKTNPEVIEYLKAENAYTEAMTKDLKPFSDALYTEMLARIKQTDLSVPTRRGDYYYYSRTEEGKQYPIQCRRKARHRPVPGGAHCATGLRET